jgi:tetratricopeptide (TPR) repeat protein
MNPPTPAVQTVGQLMQTALQHQQAGRLPQADAIYRQVLRTHPDHPDALHLSGLVAYQEGKTQLAVELISRAVRANPDSPRFYNNLGQAQRKQGNLAAAVESYRRAIALKPDHGDAHFNLGNALCEQSLFNEAIEHYRRAIALKPDHAEALFALGKVLQAGGGFEEAADYYRRAVTCRPDHAEAWCNLGFVLRVLGQMDEAIASYQWALALRPTSADILAYLAAVYIDSGQFDAARQTLAQALEREPEHVTAWAMLGTTRKLTPDDGDWLKLALKLLPDPALPTEKKCILQFMLGKYYDDTKQYDLAFAAFLQANALQRRTEGSFDRAGFSRLVDDLIATYDAAFIARQKSGASTSDLPVLVVGMPRSGTSLIEQIIASHPAAFGAGELQFWNHFAALNRDAITSGNFGAPFIANAATAYEQCLRQRSPDARRVVDKMPGNFLWAGLIHLVFPQVKILHARRNPVDTCLSIYTKNMLAEHAYSTDLDDLAFYYGEYERLMRHWKKVLPADRFLEVSYEALTDDQAAWSRRLIEFIGLEWDECCLDFHQTERKVGTASNWQVRQKIYHTSKARWRNYERHLGPLLGLLDLYT